MVKKTKSTAPKFEGKRSTTEKPKFEFINPKKPLTPQGTSKLKTSHKGKTHSRK